MRINKQVYSARREKREKQVIKSKMRKNLKESTTLDISKHNKREQRYNKAILLHCLWKGPDLWGRGFVITAKLEISTYRVEKWNPIRASKSFLSKYFLIYVTSYSIIFLINPISIFSSNRLDVSGIQLLLASTALIIWSIWRIWWQTGRRRHCMMANGTPTISSGGKRHANDIVWWQTAHRWYRIYRCLLSL